MAYFAADVMTDTDAISSLTERASGFLKDAGVDARTVHHVALVLDELLTNVASHSGVGKAPASVQLTVEPDRVDAQILDCGAEFDPRQAPSIDVTASLQDRPIGGLGLLLVQRMSDGLDYERIGDRNRTTFWIRRATAS